MLEKLLKRPHHIHYFNKLLEERVEIQLYFVIEENLVILVVLKAKLIILVNFVQRKSGPENAISVMRI